MKMNKSLRIMLMLVLAAVMLSNSGGVYATSNTFGLEEARLEYERLYKDYMHALSDTTVKGKRALAEKVDTAKRRYENLKAQFAISQTTKDKAKAATDAVVNTVSDVFSSGNGSSDVAATSTGSKILPGYEDQSIDIDGDNYCGQFAMSAVFTGMGIPATPQLVYKDTNPAGIFTAPPTIIEYLNMKGVDATQKQKASVNDIIAKIDSGKPVMVLMNSGDGTPHWVCIYGYSTGASGEITGMKMRDSYWGTRKGYDMEITAFSDMWKSPLGNKLPGNLADYSNLMIDIKGPRVAAFSPPLFSFNFHTATDDNMAGGINDVVNGFKNVAPMQVIGGVGKCLIGIPGAALSVSGRVLRQAGNNLLDWGKEKFAQPGVANKIIGGSAVAVGGVSKVAGWLANQSGNLLSSIALMAGNATKKLGYVFAR